MGIDRNVRACRGCGAKIQWIKTVGGKNHPINAEAVNVWAQQPDGKGGFHWTMIPSHSSHFSTCPNADEFRKPRDSDTVEQKTEATL